VRQERGLRLRLRLRLGLVKSERLRQCQVLEIYHWDEAAAKAPPAETVVKQLARIGNLLSLMRKCLNYKMESNNSPTHILSPTTVHSLHGQTSSTSSFETFSSAEAGSSETSPSPSPAVSDTESHTKPTVPSIELSDLSTAEPPPIDPLPSPRPQNQTLKPPTSVPKSLASSSDGTHREPSWLSSMYCKYLNRHVIGNIIGVLSLIATLIGLFVYGHKTYRLAVVAGKSSFLANCQQQVQVRPSIESSMLA